MFKMGITRSVSLAALLAAAAILPVSADHHGMNEHIIAAVANADRPSTDTERDADRKPQDVLAFAGVKPGMTVVDINSGGGYYTEILSHAVGAEGTVYAHNGPLYWNFVSTRVEERFENRLPNVVQVHEDTENVTIESGSADLAITVLAYHDYYYLPEGRKDPADVSAILASVYGSLKSGGTFVVVDHVAPVGAAPTTGNTTHRIDPMFVRKQVEAAGFKFDAENTVLANPADDHKRGVFDQDLRGKTDRFIYRFVK